MAVKVSPLDGCWIDLHGIPRLLQFHCWEIWLDCIPFLCYANYLHFRSSAQLYWVEVKFRTTKKIAQSNHEIVPQDGQIAPEGCFDPLETFKSQRWPSQLWMIAKRCKLSCSKSTSGERERESVLDLFCRKFEVLFLGRAWPELQLFSVTLGPPPVFNDILQSQNFCWLQISKFQLTLTYQQIARKERNCYDNCFVCNFMYVNIWGWLELTFTLKD